MEKSIWHISVTDLRAAKISFLLWMLSIILFSSLLTSYQSVPFLQNEFFPAILVIIVAIGFVSFFVGIITAFRHISAKNRSIGKRKKEIEAPNRARYLFSLNREAIFYLLALLITFSSWYGLSTLSERYQNNYGKELFLVKPSPSVTPEMSPRNPKIINSTSTPFIPTALPTIPSVKIEKKIPVFIGGGYNFTVYCSEDNVQAVRDMSTEMEKEYNKAFEGWKKCYDDATKRNSEQKWSCENSCRNQLDYDRNACTFAYKYDDPMYSACSNQALDEYSSCLSKCPPMVPDSSVCKQDSSKGDALFNKIKQFCGF